MKISIFTFLIVMSLSVPAFAGKIEVEIGNKSTFHPSGTEALKIHKGLECFGTHNVETKIVNLDCKVNGAVIYTNGDCDGQGGSGFAILTISIDKKHITVTHHCNGLTIK